MNEPELGQVLFAGDSIKDYPVPHYVLAAIRMIADESMRAYWNKYQEELDDPTSNTGAKFEELDTFKIRAFDWSDPEEYEPNFEWKDYRVYWYKHYMRGESANRNIDPQEAAEMLTECLSVIQVWDNTIAKALGEVE